MTTDFPQLLTRRLRLRRFVDADLAAFLAYRNLPEVSVYQDWTTYSTEEAQAFIAEMQHTDPHTTGWFNFAIELQVTGELIGDLGFLIREDDSRQGKIGYTLNPQFQGQGYATEAAERVLAYAFDDLRLHRITAAADVRNSASVRVMERLGMRREGHFIQNAFDKGEWCDEYLYAILQSEWQNRA